MKYNNFALLITGKLNIETLDRLDIYRKSFEQIVVVTWENENKNIINKYRKLCDDVILLKTENVPDYSPIHQFRAIYTGLLQVKMKYIIRMRCDEYYTDFDYMYDQIRSSPYKYTTGTFFFCFDTTGENEFARTEKYGGKFRPSDHLFGSRTDLLINTFTIIETYLSPHKQKLMKATNAQENLPFVDVSCFETLIICCFMMAQGEKVDYSDSIKLMQKYCTIIPLEKLGEFLVRANKRGVVFDNLNSYNAERRAPSHIDEI